MMPCCAGSACDECGRNGILESEGNKVGSKKNFLGVLLVVKNTRNFMTSKLQCPVCGEAANPEELIPYRLFRDKVGQMALINIKNIFIKLGIHLKLINRQTKS